MEFEQKYVNFETPLNPLTPYQENFFKKLSVALDTKIYYYGSVQRFDYFPGYSDIDICLFSGNVESTLKRVQLLLGLDQDEYDHLYIILDKEVMYECYKVIYEDTKNNLSVEISVYDDTFKRNDFYLFSQVEEYPFYVVYILFILKFMYYKLNIIPVNVYNKIKGLIIDNTIYNKKHITHRKPARW